MAWDPFGYWALVAEIRDLGGQVQAGYIALRTQLEQILANQLLEIETMTALSDAIAKLQADVTDESSAVDSAVTLLHGLKAQLDAAIAASQPVDPKPLTDLAAEIEAKTAVLAAAVAANTVADPTPPTP